MSFEIGDKTFAAVLLLKNTFDIFLGSFEFTYTKFRTFLGRDAKKGINRNEATVVIP